MCNSGHQVTLNIMFCVITDEPVGLRNNWFKVQDFGQIVDHFRRICRMYFKLIKKTQK
jgi:hypothetical protein